MRIIILLALALGLLCAGAVHAQIGSSISADGTAPNNNAMLDVKSPTTGDGKGMLIPRVTQAQRTTASSALAGGLLDNSGNLRGGAAQGLIVYQTDGSQGLYFNTSQTAVPAWVYLGTSTTNYLPLTGGTMSGGLDMGGQTVTNATYYGDGYGITNLAAGAYTETDPRWASASNAIVTDIAGRLSSNVWTAAASTTNYLPRTGGTMSGPINMDGQIVSNVAYIDFNGNNVSVGRGANGSDNGAALGYTANGYVGGVAVGRSANGYIYSAALGYQANSYWYGAAVGTDASGTNYGVAVGTAANGSTYGAAVGRSADGSSYGAAVGYLATGTTYGAAVGRSANGSSYGAAVGNIANGSASGVAMGSSANGYSTGTALGTLAKGTNYGAAVGNAANGSDYGAAVGRDANGYYFGATVGYAANGYNHGIAVGREAKGTNFGAALGRSANGAQTNVAIGAYANAQGGTERIAIGHNVTNTLDDTVRIRGKLYLDGASGGVYTNVGGFGSSDWGLKAFTIPHPLDPENKILRHFCLEGPQVWNVYAGNAQLVNGQAVVHLPDYYSALNLAGTEIYSLTPISSDRHATAVIEQEVINNSFIIGGSSDMKVSWTIKVLRNDPGCLEDLKRRPVEQRKSELETGNTFGSPARAIR